MTKNLPSLGQTLKPSEATVAFNMATGLLLALGTLYLAEGVKSKTEVPVKDIALWSLAIGGLIIIAAYNINKSAI